jgi:hypothetical protein
MAMAAWKGAGGGHERAPLQAKILLPKSNLFFLLAPLHFQSQDLSWVVAYAQDETAADVFFVGWSKGRVGAQAG